MNPYPNPNPNPNPNPHPSPSPSPNPNPPLYNSSPSPQCMNPKLSKLREKLNNKEIFFKDICISESLRLRAKNIVPCAHWITPAIEPKRFDTRFFLAKVDFKQLASHDGFELTESIWITPQDALKKLEKGEMNMIIPTIENIKALAQFSLSKDAFDYFDSLKDEEIPPILPKFNKKDGNWIGFLPGDEGYDDV